jgi:16S rRNA (uracil1498-N3)-methyltransferase
MPKHHAKKPANKSRPDPATTQFSSPGDAPLAMPLHLTLDKPFRLDRALVQRLRLREINAKEAFTIRDASGVYFRASLKEYDTRGGLALPYEQMPRSPETTLDITLACAILARQRMHFVMQKATELGVMRIVPLLTDHSVPPDGVAQEQAHAWAGHIARAARQCRRASLPELLSPMLLDSFLDHAAFTSADRRLFLDDRSDPAKLDSQSPQRILLFTGPEGGFSDAERARLAAKASPWVLGGRILRAETATLVGLTAVQLKWGDLST